ncbi:MAG: hypothetical protein HY868_07085 [Chloroflexi bacterium]|nr:hypothetical protein [Chloroflexota bacterium]
MNLLLLFQHSIMYGTLFGALMIVSFIVIALVNPEIWLKDYPPDIQVRFGAMRENAQRQKHVVTLPVVIAFIAIFVGALMELGQLKGGELSFLEVALAVMVMMTVFNAMDLIILDWIIFVTLHPRLVVLPGTEGTAGYRDYRFHLVAFSKVWSVRSF